MTESRLQTEHGISITCIKLDEVTDVIKQLNSNKSDGNYGLYSNHLLLSGFHFREHLPKLLTYMLHHGHNPGYILDAAISPIPKTIPRWISIQAIIIEVLCYLQH